MLQKILDKLTKTNTYIYCGDNRVTISRFKRDGLVECFPALASEMKLVSLARSKQFEISEAVLPKIKNRDKGTNLKESTEDKLKTFLDGNILFQDVSDANKMLIFNKDKREIVKDTDPNVFLRKIPPKERTGVVLNLPLGKVGYNAYHHEYMFDTTVASVPIKMLNLYSPPKWRTTYPEAKPEWLDEPPKVFKQFMDYLVPHEEDREELLSWMCWALVKRHHSYLVLRGSRGNGKTIFMKMLMGVIGGGYIALDGVMTDFNADMKHKRLIGIDDDTEIGTRKGNQQRKKFINSRVTYQEKHKQTTESEEQYASFVICSNPSDNFYVEWDERRVVQLELTKDKLEGLMSAKERNFLDTLADEDSLNAEQLEFLAHLGHWLLEKAKNNKRSYVHCYKGGTFWSDVINSLGGFNRTVIEMILDREAKEYSYDDLVFDWKEDKSNRQGTPSWHKFRSFIQSFRYKDEPIVESVDNKKKTFKPIDKYLPENLLEEDLMELDI